MSGLLFIYEWTILPAYSRHKNGPKNIIIKQRRFKK